MDIILYDLIIVGGGPAGITAGIYAARHNLKTLLITKSFGGQMTRKTVAIENYTGFEEISGFELIQKFERHLKKQKIEIKIGEVIKLQKENDNFSVSTEGKKLFFSKTVIVATGADPRPLEVPGEKEFIGRGVSYCVACDGPIFGGKTVAVIGGGNSAFEAALFLSAIAKKVYILEHGTVIKASESLQQKAGGSEKINVMTGVAIKKIHGEKFVSSLIYQDAKSQSESQLDVEGIFVEIGLQPATSFVKDLVDFNERDEIVVDPKTSMTKTLGLFAAGDVDCVPYKQIIISAGEGAKATLSVHNYLQTQK